MSAFRFGIRRARSGEPRQTPYPRLHVRILQSGVDLEQARNHALAFENAAAEALQARIDRYAKLNAPRVVVPIPDNGPPSQLPSRERPEEELSIDPDSEPERPSEGAQEVFFTPTSGVA
jgi:hypothetical protein